VFVRENNPHHAVSQRREKVTKKFVSKMFAALIVMSLMLAACSPQAPSPEAPAAPAAPAVEQPAASEECSFRVGYVSDVGKINDQSFNQAGWTGVQEGAKSLGLAERCYSFIETVDSADYKTNIESFVKEGYNVIVTSGFAMGQVTRQVARENPDVFFIGIDQQQVNENFEPEPYTNVAGLNFHEDIGGFLAGAAAGLMTESNVIGGVFGCQFIPAVARYEVGYRNGIKFVNPDARIINVYHPGSIEQCFADASFGAETAQSFINEGADVVYGAGGLTANGALITACNNGAMVIGTDMDHFVTLPEVKDCVLTSALKDIVTGVNDLIVAANDGSFSGGDTYGPSMLAPFHNLDSQVPADVKAQLEDIAEKLSTGEIDPCTPFEGSNPNTFCVPIK
jgi:basic membrane protein A and related proteins